MIRSLWERITEPRHMKVAYAVIYLATIVVGFVTLAMPPQTIKGEVGPIITVIWAGLFVVGGTAGLLTVFPGWWWVERLLGLAPILLGLGIYLVVVIILHAQALESGGSRATQIGIITLAASPFLLRFLVIREYSYEPRRG